MDENTPTSKAKPEGVKGCEIWEKIGGTPPVNASELDYVGTMSKSPFINHFDGANAGKLVYYWMRSINTRGVVGPWSAMVSETISG